MVKIKFHITSIQNPFQSHYRRGQTVLSFEQNVVEDTDEINNKVFRKNHQNNYKRQYRLNYIVF